MSAASNPLHIPLVWTTETPLLTSQRSFADGSDRIGFECVQFHNSGPIVSATGCELCNLSSKVLCDKGKDVGPKKESNLVYPATQGMTWCDVQNDLVKYAEPGDLAFEAQNGRTLFRFR
jgi:hypothetical protein